MNKDISTETRTAETITISRAEYESLIKQKDEITYLTNINKWLQEQLHIIEQRMFGTKSEKSSEEVIGQMQCLFDEAETYAYLEEFEHKQTVISEHVRNTSKKGFVLDKLPEGTEVVVEEHRLTDDELKCPMCGKDMEEIGHEVVRTLEIQPAKFFVHEDWYYTYKCKECETEDLKPIIKKTPHKAAFYPGSNASPSLVAYIDTQKFVMGSPLYRLEMDFRRSGYELSRQTMSNWVIYASSTWLKPLYDKLHTLLVAKDIIHADETELQVLHEPERKATSKSYMWLFRTGKYEQNPIVLYEYDPGRGGCYPKIFLEGFKGHLQTDGYAGYNQVPGVTHVGCMAHLRRRFHEAVATLPKGKKTGAAVEGEAYCTALFKLEEDFVDLTPEERRIKRQELAKPIFDEFLSWAKTRNAAPKTKLGQALTYLKNNTQELTEYLNDGKLEISNNLAERSIKPFVIYPRINIIRGIA